MKSIKYITLIILFTFLVNSCRKIECPEFDRNLLCWIPPQEVGSKLLYINQSGDSLNFTVVSKDISNAYKIKLKSKCACGADANFFATTNNNDQLKVNISQGLLQNNNYQDTASNVEVYFNSIIESGEFNIEDKINESKDSLINNKLYNIIILEHDTNAIIINPLAHQIKIWKVIYARNIGIIRIYNRNPQEVWSLIE